MQLKHFFIQDHNRTALPGATCTLYLAGTTTLATGLQDVAGNAIGNPLTADDNGLLQFAAPDGQYDLKCESGMRVYTLKVQFLDASEQIQYIEEQKAVVQQYAALVVAEYEPSVQPTLVCDFARNDHRVLGQYGLEDKTLPEQVAFTRASTATRFNALGHLEEVAVDTPRIDYDPVTGECRGLLIEEQRTNLLTFSNEFDNAVWAKNGVSVAVAADISPDGNQSASIITTTGVSSTGPSRSISSLTSAGNEYVYSLWLRTETPFTALLQIPSTSYASYISEKSIQITTKWKRFYINFSGQAGALWLRIADAGKQFSIYESQLEKGLYPSSNIPTGTTQVTRAADLPVIDTLTPWFNGNDGTVFIEGEYSAGDEILTFGDWPIVAETDGYQKIAKTYTDDAHDLVINEITGDNLTGWAASTYASVLEIAPGEFEVTATDKYDGMIQKISMDVGSVYEISFSFKRGDSNAAEFFYPGGSTWSTSTEYKALNLVFIAAVDIGVLTARCGSSPGTVYFKDFSVKKVIPDSGITLGSAHHAKINYYPRALSATELQELIA